MTFESLGLSAPILKAVSEKGYTSPSPIQEKAIPVVLDRQDVLASAQTGTGKTAGFTLPILELLSREKPQAKRAIRALILTPTRELAAQIQENVREYSTYLDIRSTVIFGGVNQNPQVRTLRQGVDILIATPGRLLDLHSQGQVNLNKVEVLVLDEADRMLDMGFLKDIQRVIKVLPGYRQNLMFSATFSKEIKLLAGGILKDPVAVEATPENTTVEIIQQRVILVDQQDKTDLITKLIDDGNWRQVLIFTRTKHRANRLSEKLEKSGISSAAIHGNKSQGARTSALAGFKDGRVRVLVATDIAARGLDIPLLPHVVNFELPNIAEDYVHRIGRTGRAGASGEALSLVDIDEYEFLDGIQFLINESLPSEKIEGFEPSNRPGDNPPPTGGGGGGRKPRGGGRPKAPGAKEDRRHSKPKRSGSASSSRNSRSTSVAGSSNKPGNGGGQRKKTSGKRW
ncbi:MAG: DEAD/DEAH box helicase [Flavobacteriales bacterium]|nr:DEAD/DEAH box helicase [Flavobacteriales bacterium]MDG1766040.1 DEAD/DEAH box helicase [Flavobacteriales bacterium]